MALAVKNRVDLIFRAFAGPTRLRILNVIQAAMPGHVLHGHAGEEIRHDRLISSGAERWDTCGFGEERPGCPSFERGVIKPISVSLVERARENDTVAQC
jgi:hypothetical protein